VSRLLRQGGKTTAAIAQRPIEQGIDGEGVALGIRDVTAQQFSPPVGCQKVPVLKSCKPGVPSGLALVSWQVMAQLLVYTLIK